MSFSATVEQMRNQTKTVTRRHPDTWAHLTRGDQLTAVEKAMGLPKGDRQVIIGTITIVSNRIESLELVDETEAKLEGFDSLGQFIEVWTELHGKYHPFETVRRIEFAHNPNKQEQTQ